jgi:hypothetical protein
MLHRTDGAAVLLMCMNPESWNLMLPAQTTLSVTSPAHHLAQLDDQEDEGRVAEEHELPRGLKRQVPDEASRSPASASSATAFAAAAAAAPVADTCRNRGWFVWIAFNKPQSCKRQWHISGTVGFSELFSIEIYIMQQISVSDVIISAWQQFMFSEPVCNKPLFHQTAALHTGHFLSAIILRDCAAWVPVLPVHTHRLLCVLRARCAAPNVSPLVQDL